MSTGDPMSYRPITDIWILTRPKAKYYGAFPAGFLERARALLGVTINDAVLHVCSGKVRDYQSGPMKGKGLGPNDKTIDLDEDLEPDFLLDVRTIGVSPGDVMPYRTEDEETGMLQVTVDGDGPYGPESGRLPWAACLIDRPYTPADAGEYAHGSAVLPDLNDLLRRSLSLTRIGGRVGVLDYVCPSPPKKGVRFIALIGVSTGYNQRARWLSVFEREAHNPLEFNVMTEGAPEEEAPAPEPELDKFGEEVAPPPVPSRNRAKKKAKKKVAKKVKKAKKKVAKKVTRPSKKKKRRRRSKTAQGVVKTEPSIPSPSSDHDW